MVLGLSGKYCAGKSSASAYLRSKGWQHIDVDQIGHQQLDAHAAEAAELFGKEIIHADGRVNRRELGRKVFSDPEKRLQLEHLLHPAMIEDIRLRISGNPEADFVLDAALLFTMGLDKLCDRILIIDAPLLVRWLRARVRDGRSIPDFIARNRAQKHIVSQARDSEADIQRVSNRGLRCSFYRALERRLSR